MSILCINGGTPLKGCVRVHGAKNSVLPILAASVLSGGRTVIHNCPSLSDVASSLAILRYLGCTACMENGSVYIDSRSMSRSDIPDSLMCEMRSSVIFMGAILARTGHVKFSAPGGCEIGERPIDLHLSAMAAMGADIQETAGSIECRADVLHGGVIDFTFPSVGATENCMIAAVTAVGKTVINNAAREPEICDLANYLRSMGARVTGDGTGRITVEGAPLRKYVEHTVIPDRIVTATFLAAAAATNGNVTVEGAIGSHVEPILHLMGKMGCTVTDTGKAIAIDASGRLTACGTVTTRPYPGFPTDAQPIMMAACLRAQGETVFRENIFENRFRHVEEMLRMGADITVKDRVAVVRGVDRLFGKKVSALELRGCAALVAAALGAEGESIVEGVRYLDRGYDGLCEQLSGLGADIHRI